MHARMIQVTTKPGQIKDCTKAMFGQSLPLLKQNPGFLDALILSSDTDRDHFVGVTFWRSREDAETYVNGQARQEMDAIRPFLQDEPTFCTFNLEASTMHRVGLARAAASLR
jgi:heme-degrading monooxygenase HmoA